MTPFCAICTSETGPFVTQPFGRDGGLVLVCNDCDTVHPSTGRYGFAEGTRRAQNDQGQTIRRSGRVGHRMPVR